MTKQDFKDLVEETRSLHRKFKSPFDKRDRVLDLVEEVGELANAVLIVEKRKTITAHHPRKNKTKADVADALSDILFNVILLADDYDVDLLLDYERMLADLKRRLERGEFGK